MARKVVEGMEELTANMNRLAKEYGRATAQAAITGAELVRSEAVKSIQSVSGGETVTRTREGGGIYEHVASRPGDAPNTDTGRLVGSIQVDVKHFGVFVGSTVPYSGHLEFGTTTMEARPWLNPALEARRRDIEKLFIQAAKPEGKV